MSEVRPQSRAAGFHDFLEHLYQAGYRIAALRGIEDAFVIVWCKLNCCVLTDADELRQAWYGIGERSVLEVAEERLTEALGTADAPTVDRRAAAARFQRPVQAVLNPDSLARFTGGS
ncbi:hypothetical protein HY375_00640 [Candidatus Berkelbacteria bacterium]|nr:hypothetical protein [Candidatus Berkelbacteria bacterium]